MRALASPGGGQLSWWTKHVKIIFVSSGVLSLAGGVAGGATLDASYFGFSTNAANNFQAMRALEAYVNTKAGVAVTFQPGTYVVSLPGSADPGYRGMQQAACMLTGVSGATIDAASAEFYCTNLDSEQAIFQFRSCTNIILNAQFRGEHQPVPTSGVKSVHLVSSNSAVNINIRTTKMYDGVRIGNYEDPSVIATPTYDGNGNITVVATNLDTYYGVAAYLARDLNITCQSVGTSANGFGAYRCVYLNGCSNVMAYSYCRDLAVPDGCNIIGSGPSALSPYHFGASNVTMYAMDLGSTNNVLYQSLVKLGVVTSSVSATNITLQNIRIIVNAPSTSTIRPNLYTVAIGSLGTGAAHVYTNITISGTVGRGPSNRSPAIKVESTLAGLAVLQLALDGFYDPSAPTQDTVMVASSLPRAIITAVDSTVNRVDLANPANQTFNNLGKRPPAPGDVHVMSAKY
jgi:hypothetical protein